MVFRNPHALKDLMRGLPGDGQPPSMSEELANLVPVRPELVEMQNQTAPSLMAQGEGVPLDQPGPPSFMENIGEIEVGGDAPSQMTEWKRQFLHWQVQMKDWLAANTKTKKGTRWRAAAWPSTGYDDWIEGRNSGKIHPGIEISPRVQKNPETFQIFGEDEPGSYEEGNRNISGGFITHEPIIQNVLTGVSKGLARTVYGLAHSVGPVTSALLELGGESETARRNRASGIGGSLADDPVWQSLSPDEASKWEKFGFHGEQFLEYFVGPSVMRGAGRLALSSVPKAVTKIYAEGASKSLKRTASRWGQRAGYMASEGLSDAAITSAQGGGAREIFNAFLLGSAAGPFMGAFIGKIGDLGRVRALRKWYNWILQDATLDVAMNSARSKARSAYKMVPNPSGKKVPKIDEAGNVVTDRAGKEVMEPEMIRELDIHGDPIPVRKEFELPDEATAASDDPLGPGWFDKGTDNPFTQRFSFLNPDRDTVVSQWFSENLRRSVKLRNLWKSMKDGLGFQNGWGIYGFVEDKVKRMSYGIDTILKREGMVAGEELAKQIPRLEESFKVVQEVFQRFADNPAASIKQVGVKDAKGDIVERITDLSEAGKQLSERIGQPLQDLIRRLSIPVTSDMVTHPTKFFSDAQKAAVKRGDFVPYIGAGLDVTKLTAHDIYEMRRILDDLTTWGKIPSINDIKLTDELNEQVMGAANVLRKGLGDAVPEVKPIITQMSRYLDVRDGIIQMIGKRNLSGDAALVQSQFALSGALANNQSRLYGGGMNIGVGSIGAFGATPIKWIYVGEAMAAGANIITKGIQGVAYVANKEAIATGEASQPWDLFTTPARYLWAQGEQTRSGELTRPDVRTVGPTNYAINPLIAELGPDYDESMRLTTPISRTQGRLGLVGGSTDEGRPGTPNMWWDYFNQTWNLATYNFDFAARANQQTDELTGGQGLTIVGQGPAGGSGVNFEEQLPLTAEEAATLPIEAVTFRRVDGQMIPYRNPQYVP